MPWYLIDGFMGICRQRTERTPTKEIERERGRKTESEEKGERKRWRGIWRELERD